jgi:transposase
MKRTHVNVTIRLDLSDVELYYVAMYIDVVPNRSSPPAILLREAWRDGKRIRKRTLANLSKWPQHKIDALRAILKGAPADAASADAFEIVRSLPHGHVAACLGTLRRIGLEASLARKRSRRRDLSVALIVGRLIAPGSKLSLARSLQDETRSSSLGEELGISDADEDELYAAMDWLLGRQHRIETALARRHLSEGTIVLYDVSSSYFEGRHCSLARIGHSRDRRFDRPQIVFGLLTDAEGCPVATQVFDGNTGDPSTLGQQIRKLRERFGLERMVLVGDRGMITSARIEQNLKPVSGLDWITALRGPAIKKLVAAGVLDVSLFDEKDLAEIRSPDYPGERLIVCRNPLLAEERRRKRQDLLQATEKELEKVVAATRRDKNRLKGKDRIGLRVGRVLGRFKMAKHFQIEISDDGFRYQRDQNRIAQEAALDGFYVIRTSLEKKQISAEDTVACYKRLAHVERAFRSLKTVDLKIRPIHHHLRVRAHVFICMLAYYVEWHMRQALAPLLFDDDDRAAAAKRRSSAVAKAQRSRTAEQKARRKQTKDGFPVHSFQTLLRDLATLGKNRIQPKDQALEPFEMITAATPLQQRALDLLGVSPNM